MDTPRDIPPEPSLITYPTHFPIKVMGANVEGFAEAIVHIVRQKSRRNVLIGGGPRRQGTEGPPVGTEDATSERPVRPDRPTPT